MPLAGHRCKNPHEILTQDEIDRIHFGSLEVLSETGMTIADERSRMILQEGGCEVDHEIERVRFPPDLVQWAIDQCPDVF